MSSPPSRNLVRMERISAAIGLVFLGMVLNGWIHNTGSIPGLERRAEKLVTIQTKVLPQIAKAAGKGDDDTAAAIALQALGKPVTPFTPRLVVVTPKKTLAASEPSRPLPMKVSGPSPADRLNRKELRRIRSQPQKQLRQSGGDNLPVPKPAGIVGDIARASGYEGGRTP